MERVRIIIPDEQLVVVELKIDGKPYVGVINKGLANFTHKDVFGWYLSLIIHYERTVGDGMPDKDTTLKMQDFSDALSKGLSGNSCHPNVFFLARVTGDGYTEIMWYVNNPKLANEYLQGVIERKNYPLDFDYEIRADLNWAEAAYWLSLFESE